MDIGNIPSLYNDVNNAASSRSASRLENKLNSDYQNATEEELMSVCKEFEAYFLEQVMKQMWKTIPQAAESSGANATLKDYYQGEMIREMASSSTEQNSIGLAQALYEQMKRNYGL